MSKINQIQNALKELDGGAFQKLADSYLLKKGYGEVNPIGSVVGNNKVRKGTPDTLIPNKNGKYTFVEYTTVETNLCKKFKGDIEKCFDESKTGIKVSDIDEVVVCYNSQLSTNEINKLQQICKNNSINFNQYGLGTIAYDLLEKFPGIAKDYLGIEVDTGQIVELQAFIKLYEKNKLATTLQTQFYFREQEKEVLLKELKQNELIIVSGSPGVGKSRLAIECYESFLLNNPKYKGYSIYNQGVDLFDDLKAYFSDSGDYLIFVDDANRLSGFEYIIGLIQNKRDDQNIKVIATVRDYALRKLQETTAVLDSTSDIKLEGLSEKEISSILKEEFEIYNHLYVDRILDIAQGNPRLAVMAASIAKNDQTLESIRDVTQLYDQYFSSIKKDLDALKDDEILKTAGITAFFQYIDTENTDLMSDIKTCFEIDARSFWKNCQLLHDMEIFDMYEREVVKVSDQVLSTFLFYQVFLKEQKIDISLLLDNLFPKYKSRLIDSLNPVLNAFNYQEIKELLQRKVDKVWSKLEKEEREVMLQFINVFWFLKPTETLLYIKNIINNDEESEDDKNNINYKSENYDYLPEYFSVLPSFRYSGKELYEISLDLILLYANKNKHNTEKIIKFIIDEYGYDPESYSYDYVQQKILIDWVIKNSDHGSNERYSRMLLSITEVFLKTHFSSVKNSNKASVTLVRFNLVDTKKLKELRGLLLSYIFKLYKQDKYKSDVLSLLLRHSNSGYDINVESIVENDSKLIISFFNKELEKNDIYHCVIVQDYLNLLRRLNISFDQNLSKKFSNDRYNIYDFFTNQLEMAGLKLDIEAYDEYKVKRFKQLTESYTLSHYRKLFKDLQESLEKIGGDRFRWQIKEGVTTILECLIEKNIDLAKDTIKDYVHSGDYFKIFPGKIIATMSDKTGHKVLFDFLNSLEFSGKDYWLFMFYYNVRYENINKQYCTNLLKLLKTASHDDYSLSFDSLLKYEAFERGFIRKSVATVLNRSNEDARLIQRLGLLFNHHTEAFKKIDWIFDNEYQLLEKAYLAYEKSDIHADHDGRILNMFLDNSRTFIKAWLDDFFSRKPYISHYDDKRDYSTFWLRDDYREVMGEITDYVYNKELEGKSHNYYEAFFNNTNNKDEVLNNQNSLLLHKINENINDSGYLNFIFSVVSGFELKRKIIFYKRFLEINKAFENFSILRFEPMHESWSGSRVPLLERKVVFYKELIDLCKGIDYLEHRGFLEKRIQQLRDSIQSEKKRDFIDHI